MPFEMVTNIMKPRMASMLKEGVERLDLIVPLAIVLSMFSDVSVMVKFLRLTSWAVSMPNNRKGTNRMISDY